MHIVSGQVQSQSQHQFSHVERRVAIQQRLLQPQPAQPSAPTRSPPIPLPGASIKQAASNVSADEFDTGNDKQLSLLKALVEALTGKAIETLDLGDTSPPPRELNIPTAAASNSRVATVEAVQVSETESTEVAFSGQFNTDQGNRIDVDLAYSLQRSYQTTSIDVSTRAANGGKDPLILNFNGVGVALDAKQTTFDLDGDGDAESIASLASGSAYLALDRNADGVIDNGTELFGPATDDGYAELAKLDSDGNGFIDSADPLFSHLLLFRPGEATRTLADADVGAIFTGSAASPARLTDSNNRSLGQLRATGFYLTNQGGAGLVQEFDLSI